MENSPEAFNSLPILPLQFSGLSGDKQLLVDILLVRFYRAKFKRDVSLSHMQRPVVSRTVPKNI